MGKNWTLDAIIPVISDVICMMSEQNRIRMNTGTGLVTVTAYNLSLKVVTNLVFLNYIPQILAAQPG
jgi:hypothetical protein